MSKYKGTLLLPFACLYSWKKTDFQKLRLTVVARQRKDDENTKTTKGNLLPKFSR